MALMARMTKFKTMTNILAESDKDENIKDDIKHYKTARTVTTEWVFDILNHFIYKFVALIPIWW